MIYIQLTYKRPPKSIINILDNHTTNIKAQATIELKKKYIDDTSNIWTQLRFFFEGCSNSKCWISEASESVSLHDVDHFRPKKKVVKLDKKLKCQELERSDWELGYWWITYNWKNYRLMGQIPNRCFKKNYFPLKYGTKEATLPTDKISLETPLLLDPTVKGDVSLLNYDLNGKVIPAFSSREDNWKNLRAEISILLYGLNDEKLIKARKKTISRCIKIIKRTNSVFKELQSITNKRSRQYIYLRKIFSDYCSDLSLLVSIDEEFSATAKATILSHNYIWIKKYIPFT